MIQFQFVRWSTVKLYAGFSTNLTCSSKWHSAETPSTWLQVCAGSPTLLFICDSRPHYQHCLTYSDCLLLVLHFVELSLSFTNTTLFEFVTGESLDCWKVKVRVLPFTRDEKHSWTQDSFQFTLAMFYEGILIQFCRDWSSCIKVWGWTFSDWWSWWKKTKKKYIQIDNKQRSK